jgi:rubrerythrin
MVHQVCQVCGYVTDKKAPKKCPVSGKIQKHCAGI